MEKVFLFIFVFAVLGFWIFTLVDAASRAKNKAVWVLIILLFSPGFIIYWMAAEREPKGGARRDYRGGARGARPVRGPRRRTAGPAASGSRRATGGIRRTPRR